MQNVVGQKVTFSMSNVSICQSTPLTTLSKSTRSANHFTNLFISSKNPPTLSLSK